MIKQEALHILVFTEKKERLKVIFRVKIWYLQPKGRDLCTSFKPDFVVKIVIKILLTIIEH